MTNQTILNWINENKDKKSETEMKDELLKQEWKLEDINDALDIAFGRGSESQKKMKKVEQVIVAIIIIGCFSFIIWSCSSCFDSASESTPGEKPVGFGEEGILKSNGDIVYVTHRKEDYERFTTLLAAEDYTGGTMMVREGKIIEVKPGTKVKVINTAFFGVEVRILEGPYKGYSGWIDREWIK